MKDIHTFVILAYKENDNLEDCIKSVLNQKYKRQPNSIGCLKQFE